MTLSNLVHKKGLRAKTQLTDKGLRINLKIEDLRLGFVTLKTDSQWTHSGVSTTECFKAENHVFA